MRRLLAHADLRQRVGDQLDGLGWDAGQQFGEVVGVAPVAGHEHPDDPGRVDRPAGPGLEADAAAGDDDLLPGGVAGEHDVVVEDAQYLHGTPAILLSWCGGGAGRRWDAAAGEHHGSGGVRAPGGRGDIAGTRGSPWPR
nr:hypothetical protein [Propioniciclava coleopterorum]